MRSVFLDPSVLLLAVGGEYPARPACRAVVDRAAQGELRLHLSVEGGQEFLFHRMRRADISTALAQFDLIDRLVVWHAFDVEILRAARALVATASVRGRDAVHAATALAGGFTAIISSDADFDRVPGLARLDPLHDEI
ncbi:MAG: type II toxin-antitoxin system VapC family toxin [Actinomycetia bacterium]|nr:type II toxin-antitoxin system VapC family toxin [Actinomycetes bacterium]